jgi:exodeoxyribonuclease VII large subunit
MTKKLSLSELVNEIDNTLQNRFAGDTFWITAEITDVKVQDRSRNYRFIKFVEKLGSATVASIDAVFWARSLPEIDRFEKLTNSTFKNGLELTCRVAVTFNNRYGIKLEVLEIDCSYALGKLEMDRQLSIEKLVNENPNIIKRVDEQFFTLNKSLLLPLVIQRIAFITAPNSDGQRDFNQELQHNKYCFAFKISEFLTQIQGDNASNLLLEKLKLIELQQDEFDVVVIARGGGSQLDLQPFDDYELARTVAGFPLPIFTGIGHDRNTSIVDLMARQHKTPTKVANYILDHNQNFENEIVNLTSRIRQKAELLLNKATDHLIQMKRTLKAYNPETILKKGYAIVYIDGKIVSDVAVITENIEITTQLKEATILSTVSKIKK